MTWIWAYQLKGTMGSFRGETQLSENPGRAVVGVELPDICIHLCIPHQYTNFFKTIEPWKKRSHCTIWCSLHLREQVSVPQLWWPREAFAIEEPAASQAKILESPCQHAQTPYGFLRRCLTIMSSFFGVERLFFPLLHFPKPSKVMST